MICLASTHEAFSFIPPRADGCKYKFSYELSDESYAATSDFFKWDLRDDPPAWWPCDEAGELRSDLGFEPPKEIEPGECLRAQLTVDADYPPPPATEIHCVSDHEYTFRPLWSDICDGRLTVALWGEISDMGGDRSSWVSSRDAGFPCDMQGKFIPRPGLSEY